MRIFGLIVEREKSRVVGSYGPAIIDLQGRVNVLEHNQKVKVQVAEHEQDGQTEIERILAGGRNQGSDLWEVL
ncbi:unnamed protein product [marine sediment metagenome]|uniref:Uncharacterized protein n=1 Tax=marine sediment metagenome TaxID=412755 RepID=X1FHR4_9ZZZZ